MYRFCGHMVGWCSQHGVIVSLIMTRAMLLSMYTSCTRSLALSIHSSSHSFCWKYSSLRPGWRTDAMVGNQLSWHKKRTNTYPSRFGMQMKDQSLSSSSWSCCMHDSLWWGWQGSMTASCEDSGGCWACPWWVLLLQYLLNLVRRRV